MNTVLILLKRYINTFIKNINNYVVIYFLLPIFMYGLLVAPLSSIFSFIDSSSMSYSYHSIPAVIFLTTILISLYTPLIILNNDFKNKFQLYILTYSNKNLYFSSIILFTILCSYLEFFISFILVYNLSDAATGMGIMISSIQLFYLALVTLPSILLFTCLGILVSNFFKKIENIVPFIFFIFLLISFGSSTFIPIDYYPLTLSDLISDYNIIYLQYNQYIHILSNNSINLGVVIISLTIAVILYFLNILFFKNRNQY